MKVAAPPYSPPVENPWIIRSAISSAGAQKPMLSYEGIRTTQKVAPAISNMVKASTDLRPMRSPSGPQNSPPSGRMRKEMAKVASEYSTACSVSPGNHAAEIKVTPIDKKPRRPERETGE